MSETRVQSAEGVGRPLAGTRALVTGASSGIGRAIARAFSERGAEVGLVARAEDRLREGAEELPGPAAWRRADVSPRSHIRAAVDELADELGGINVVVNNAGFTGHVFADTDPDEAERIWDDVLATDLKGPFLTALAVTGQVLQVNGGWLFGR